jgi:hypothetical protein
MCTIFSICLANYIYRHRVDSCLDYLNNKEALIFTICSSVILEIVTAKCEFFKKKH